MDRDAQKGQARKRSVLLNRGDVVADQYTVIECLGVGSTSTVYRVRHKSFGEHDLVLKVLHAEFTNDETAVARFQTELLASYEVNHPNVIRSYEFIRADGLLGYTMEFAAGGDLRRLMSDTSRFAFDEAIRIMEQIASGLAAIHAASIVHRDLKPENIYFTKDGCVKIADFGIARLTGRNLTKHGEVIGAIDFCSPEYIESGKVDARSDIYALGLIGYELVTGRPAFRGGSAMDTLMQRMTRDAIPPQEIRQDCPPRLGAFIMRALRRNPDDRFQSSRHVLDELEAIRMNVPADEEIDGFEPEPPAPRTLREAVSPEVYPQPHARGREPQLRGRFSGTHAAAATGSLLVMMLLTAWLFVGGEESSGGTVAPAVDERSREQAAAAPAVEAKDPPAKAPEDRLAETTAPVLKEAPAAAAAVAAPPISPEKVAVSVPAAPKSPAAPQMTEPESKEAPKPEKLAKAPSAPAQSAPGRGVEREALQPPSRPVTVRRDGSTDGGAVMGSYTIASGDTPSSIARRFSMPTAELMKLNGISDPTRLRVGQVLKVPQAAPAPPAEQPIGDMPAMATVPEPVLPE